MSFFTTYFDRNYLSRGLVLYDSLKKYCKKFELYILCLDEFTFEYFLKNNKQYPEVNYFSLPEIEDFDEELKECKLGRTIIEYYFTLSPCLPLYLLKKYNLPFICSLDADIMFFSSPDIVFSYLSKYSILITPHNFSNGIKSREIYGKYNVSFQVFKNDENGLNCLELWRNQCINWCYDKIEEGKFADQKYLDSWDLDYGGVFPIDLIGVGVAPWNINSYTLRFYKNQIYVNENEVIFYHFHGLRVLKNNMFFHGLSDYDVDNYKMIIRYIYKPYLKKLLFYKLQNDFEVKRNRIDSKSTIKIILFQKDWVFYTVGIMIWKTKFIDILCRGITIAKNQIYKLRK
jgi:hypothetical protein